MSYFIPPVAPLDTQEQRPSDVGRTPPLPGPRRKTAPWKYVLIGAVVLVVLAGLGVLILFNTLRRGMGDLFAGAEKTEYVVEAFLRNMRSRDVEKAYALFSERARQQLSRAELEESLSETNYVLFDGFDQICIQNLIVSHVVLTDPRAPQGKVAQLRGSVLYKDGYTGTFDAVLEMEGERWRLYTIHVTVPPAKMEEYFRRQAGPTPGSP